MIYSEASFIGYPVAHCAAWEDDRRLKRVASRSKLPSRPDRRETAFLKGI